MRCRNGNGQGLKAGIGDLGNFRARREIAFRSGPPGVGCLTFDRNGNWLCKLERKPRLRGNRDVLLSGSGGTCRAGTSTHCTPDQRSLPPPARAPISAPAAAPPPMYSTLRLLWLGQRGRLSWSQWHRTFLPLPLSAALGVGSRVVQMARFTGFRNAAMHRAPLGITVLPSTTTGSEMLASKSSPAWLRLLVKD